MIWYIIFIIAAIIAFRFRRRKPVEVLPQPLSLERRKCASLYHQLAAEIFGDLIEKYGGTRTAIRTNASIPRLHSADPKQLLTFDLWYAEGGHRIAVDFHGVHQFTYPNDVHANSKEFHRDVQRDTEKFEAARAEDVYLLCVPFYVDRWVEDPKAETGWTFAPDMPAHRRKFKLYQYFTKELTQYYHSVLRET